MHGACDIEDERVAASMSASQALLSRLSRESGFSSVLHAPRDTKLLCLQRFVRLFAYGTAFLILVHHLSVLGFGDARIGLFMTSTLLGDVVVSFLLTLITDQVGRRRVLAAGAALMAVSGLVFAVSSNFWLLLVASVVGVISPRYVFLHLGARETTWLIIKYSGNEVGPFRAVEESTIAALTPPAARADVFAWYALLGNVGTAVGIFAAGWAGEVGRRWAGGDALDNSRRVFLAYAVLGAIKLVLACSLSTRVEVRGASPSPAASTSEDEETPLLRSAAAAELVETKSSPRWLPVLSRTSRGVVIKLCVLFAIDAFASGMGSLYVDSRATGSSSETHARLTLLQELGHVFLQPKVRSRHRRSRVHLRPRHGPYGRVHDRRRLTVQAHWQCEGMYGGFSSNLLRTSLMMFSVSDKSLDCLNWDHANLNVHLRYDQTMVFCHLPSAFFLALTPLPASLPGALAFLLLAACSHCADVGPRTAFLAAALRPHERTAVLGALTVVKTAAHGLGPLLTGALASGDHLGLALVVAGALKAVYDLGLLAAFAGPQTAPEKAEVDEDEESEEEGYTGSAGGRAMGRETDGKEGSSRVREHRRS